MAEASPAATSSTTPATTPRADRLATRLELSNFVNAASSAPRSLATQALADAVRSGPGRRACHTRPTFIGQPMRWHDVQLPISKCVPWRTQNACASATATRSRRARAAPPALRRQAGAACRGRPPRRRQATSARHLSGRRFARGGQPQRPYRRLLGSHVPGGYNPPVAARRRRDVRRDARANAARTQPAPSGCSGPSPGSALVMPTGCSTSGSGRTNPNGRQPHSCRRSCRAAGADAPACTRQTFELMSSWPPTRPTPGRC